MFIHYCSNLSLTEMLIAPSTSFNISPSIILVIEGHIADMIPPIISPEPSIPGKIFVLFTTFFEWSPEWASFAIDRAHSKNWLVVVRLLSQYIESIYFSEIICWALTSLVIQLLLASVGGFGTEGNIWSDFSSEVTCPLARASSFSEQIPVKVNWLH